jgi:hypothetical protein
MPKNTVPRRASAPKKPKTKPAAKRPAVRPKMHGPYAQTAEQNLSHIRMNIQATVPGMLDTDELFRRMIVGYLLDHYRKEVLSEIAAGVKRTARAAHAN